MVDRSALLQAIADAAKVQVAPDPAAQDDLFQEHGDALADAPFLGEVQGRRRLPGRPKGARNLRTQELADYCLQRYRHPVLALGEIVSTPLAQLRHTLGCSLYEAAEFWRRCLADYSKFVVQEQPKSLQLAGPNAGSILVIQQTAGQDATPALINGAAIDLGIIEENQRVVDALPAPSHGDTSHDEGKP